VEELGEAGRVGNGVGERRGVPVGRISDHRRDAPIRSEAFPGQERAGPWRWLHLGDLFDDWIFSREYIRCGNSEIEQRLDRLAAELVAAASNSAADEILVIGHSLGAALAVDLLDRALKLDPALGRNKIPVTFLSVGSSILKIGLHPKAIRFGTTVERVAKSRAIFWGDYQALSDR
jgi:hypothetical protein